MSEFRLSPEAEADLDDIWIRIARGSGSVEIATRVVDSIAERFWLLARYPHLGRQRDEDLWHGIRSLPADALCDHPSNRRGQRGDDSARRTWQP